MKGDFSQIELRIAAKVTGDARMLEAYPMVPLSRNLNLGVAILSYCGTLHLGLLADRDQWPDLDVLEAGVDDSFAELTKLAREKEARADA